MTARWARGEAAIFVGAFLLPLAIFAALAIAVTSTGTPGWDEDILRFSDRRLYDASVAGALELLLYASIALGAVLAAAFIVVFLKRRMWSRALFWALTVGGVLGFDFLLKEIFQRPPLGHGGGYSFPSGNAMASLAIVAALALTCSPRWRRSIIGVGVPLVFVYGLVLVYQWWHYPSDVVAGWCISLAWVTGLWLVTRRFASSLAPSGGPPGRPTRDFGRPGLVLADDQGVDAPIANVRQERRLGTHATHD